LFTVDQIRNYRNKGFMATIYNPETGKYEKAGDSKSASGLVACMGWEDNL
jgi:hypothetical protein